MKDVTRRQVVGECEDCHHWFQIRSDGKVRSHTGQDKAGPALCPGSGKHPLALKKDPHART